MLYRSSLNKLPYKTRIVPKPIGGGLNNGLGFDIKDNEFTEVQNVQTRFFPQVRTRYPRTDVGAQLTGPMYHLGTRESDYLTAVDDDEWKKYDGGSWSVISSLSASHEADTVDFLGFTYIANGTDRKRYNGTTTTDVTQMPNVDLLEVYSSRIYAASTDNDILYFSAIATGDDWTSANDAGEIQVTTRDGQYCTGLVTYSNHILYFKKNSIHELYGTNPGNFYMQTLTNQIGCVSPRSIIEIEGILYFAGIDGIYAYDGGGAPTKLSWPFVQKFFDEVDDTRYSEFVSGTDGDRLYMVVPYSNTRVLLTYDTNNSTWSAEDDIQIVEFATFDNKLYGMGEDGQLRQMIDPDGSFSGIEGFFITKAFDQQSISSKKSVKQVHIAAQMDSGSTITVSISPDAEGDTFTEIGEITDETLQVHQFLVPVSFDRIAQWNRVKVSFSGNVTIHNMELQLRIIPNNF